MQSAPQKEATGYYHCQRCGHCCKWPGFVRLTQDDIERAAAYLGEDVAQMVAAYTDLHPSRTHLMFKNKSDGVCIMYDELEGSCRIHPVKPIQCVGFPNTWNFEGWERICEAVLVEGSKNE